MRTLCAIANGYEENSSEYIEDRFYFYLEVFIQGMEQVRAAEIGLVQRSNTYEDQEDQDSMTELLSLS